MNKITKIDEAQQEFIITKLVENDFKYNFSTATSDFVATYNKLFNRIEIALVARGLYAQGHINNDGTLRAGLPFADELFNEATNYLFNVEYLDYSLPKKEAVKTKKLKI